MTERERNCTCLASKPSMSHLPCLCPLALRPSAPEGGSGEVTQADIDAAADWHRMLGGIVPAYTIEEAFARHRRQAVAEAEAGGERSLDQIMLGRFVAQYDEGSAGFFVDADEAQEVALQVKASLGLGKSIMDEIDSDASIPTVVACKVFAAIKRAFAAAIPSGVSEEGAATLCHQCRQPYPEKPAPDFVCKCAVCGNPWPAAIRSGDSVGGTEG